MKTTLAQISTTYEDDTGVVHFKIDNTLTNVLEGDLPHSDIFLHQINVSEDPKSDTFMRIASLTDLGSVIRSRSSAASVAKTTYLDSRFTIEFDDLSTAVQGKNVIQARVDDLIANWRIYQEQLLAPSSITLPLTMSSVVSASKEALKKANADKAKKQATYDKFVLELIAAQSAADLAGTSLVTAQELYSRCVAFQSQQMSVQTGMSTSRDALKVFMSAAAQFIAAASTHYGRENNDTTFADALENFQAAYETELAALVDEQIGPKSVSESLSSEMSSQCSQLASNVATAKEKKKQADAALATAQTKVTLAEAALEAASAAVDAALVTVKNYCPLFDPLTDL